ncbi:hypothetical protein DAPPUDRAFT_127578 [Daphnia pulex]|uniref:MARVEL domain-containing protein n=1 Tax=Daphnia pulex TaxID=6669 RepID=E9G5F9_DAPPU|nr:hypothetical protein DAPPUDRAFT_127578 [Daphnia pulex]|eukprot:EFX85636.1 hypothetical protein DAPPUDRAFT_127578 [Daphnia pulex]
MSLKVNHCCCGCSLQTGTKIIGWLYLVSEIIAIVMLVLVEVLPEEQTSQTTTSETGNSETFAIMEITSIVTAAIKILVTVPLLIAAYKNSRPMLLLPWLICAIVTALMAIGTGIASVINSSGKETFFNEIIANTVVNFLGSALTIYYWIVVYSFYRRLRETQP